MPDLHDTLTEHTEGHVAPPTEHAALTARMPDGSPGQSWPEPAPVPSLAELADRDAPVQNAEAVEPKRRGPGRPKGPPVARRLHLALDAPAWQSLQMIVEILQVYGRAGTLSEAVRFAIDLTARTLAPSTTLLRAEDVTARTARLMREAAEATR